MSSGALMEDEKVTPLGLSDQLPSAQGLLQATPSPAPFNMNQVWNKNLVSLLCWTTLINCMFFLSITGCCFLWLQVPTQIPNIGTHVIINQKLSGFGLQMHFQRYVAITMLLFLFESMCDLDTIFFITERYPLQWIELSKR